MDVCLNALIFILTLIHPGDVDLPVFDTALIHAKEAALTALK